MSNLSDKAFEAWRNRAFERTNVYVDGIYLKRSWGGSFESVAVMVAIGVNSDGYREDIGSAEGLTESAECWREFLSWLKSRGLLGARMFAGDKAAGMVGSIAEVSPMPPTSSASSTSTGTSSRRPQSRSARPSPPC